MKTPEMVNGLDVLSKQMFGRTRSESLKQNTCVICGQSADAFRDTLSQKEYGISGMCQECQDATFGV